jgi:hypothetical protein
MVWKLFISMPNTLSYLPTVSHDNFLQVFASPSMKALNELGEFSFIVDRQSGYPMDFNRNCSVESALESGADFWITFDSDMAFPTTVLADMVRVMFEGGERYDLDRQEVVRVNPEEVEVLSGLYFKKAPPFPPVSGVFIRDDRPERHAPINTEHQGLIRCDVVGGGCLCVRPDALRKLGDPWFKYMYGKDDKGKRFASSEDVWFSRQCADKGIGVWTDSRIKCGHLTSFMADERNWNIYRNGIGEEPGLFSRETGELNAMLFDEETRANLKLDPKKWPGTGPR